MDDINRMHRHARLARISLDGVVHDRGRATQRADTTPLSSLGAQPRTLPSNVNAEIQQMPLSFCNCAIDSSQRLPQYPPNFPAASSAANVMSTLEQQPASLDDERLNWERQRSHVLQQARSSLSERVSSVEQHLSFYIEEKLRRSASTSATSCLPGRPLDTEHQHQLASLHQHQQGRHQLYQATHQLAALQQQQQGRHQPFQATHNALDRIPTIDQLLASLEGGRGSLQPTGSLDEHLASLIKQQGRSGDFQDRRVSTIEQQLASLNDEQQRRHGSFQAASSVQQISSTIEQQLALFIEGQQGRNSYVQDRTVPTMEQQLNSLIGATSTSPSSHFPSHHMAEHETSQLLSLEDQQLLAQLQRNTASQVQLEPQVQARGFPLEHAVQGRTEQTVSLPSPVPTEHPISVPPAYGRHGQLETFPEKLYRLLAEAEKDGNDRIISFTSDGRAFKIHNRQAFIEEVSPKYFRHAKTTSFVRQLNFYGFQKLLDGPNRGAFTNPPFIRGHPELLVMLKRKEVAPRPKRSPGHCN